MKPLSSVQEHLQRLATQAATNFEEKIRVARAREFLACAELTAERKETTAIVCLRWSRFANQCLSDAFTEASRRVQIETPLALFAYGKLGAEELNLSSDVDLVLISESDDPELKNWLRCFRQLLHESTELGFVFRLDFDLRPGGRMGPLIPTYYQFEDYFSNYGEAWERLAFVRFQGICGDSQLRERALALSEKFTFRKHLDFTLLDDLKALRQRLYEQNWKRSENGALDLKLGLGGIRDLELFVHAQQVIHGGRQPNLRTRSTETALRNLKDKKILEAADSDFLIQHYWNLRHYENLLQSVTDQQIQVLQANDWSELITFQEREKLKSEMLKCQKLVEDLLGPVDLSALSLPEREEDQIIWLESLGYSKSKIDQIWPSLIHRTALSRQAERDELYRKRFLFEMCERISKKSTQRDQTLEIFHDFLKAIRAKTSFFHLLLQNPSLMDRLTLLFSNSVYLSQMMIQRPELLDSFLYQKQDDRELLDWDELLQGQVEKKMLTEMSAGLQFLEDHRLEPLLETLSNLADTIVAALKSKLESEFHTPIRVLAMGKWGGRELGLRSDLDLVFLTEGDPTEAHTRVARRMISRLTEVQKGGSLYQLDFRLKPRGKGGPLLTSSALLLKYLEHEAEPWERQAYLKARFLTEKNGDPQIWRACLKRGLTKESRLELDQIQKALHAKAKHPWDLKYASGGLVHCEFVVQLFRLAHQELPVSTNTLLELKDLESRDSAWKQIHGNYRELRTLEQLLRLTGERSEVVFDQNSEALQLLVKILKSDSNNLMLRIQSLLSQNAALLAPLDPRQSQG